MRCLNGRLANVMRTNWFSSRPIHRPKNSLLATKFLRQLKHRNNRATMSALGQKQTSDCRPAMSALLPKADIGGDGCDVRFLPKADIQSPYDLSLENASFR